MAKGDWWFKFEWNDWLGDEKLSTCSLETQGFWIRCICLMRRSDASTISGTVDQLRRRLGCLPEEVERCIEELERTGTADVTKSHENVTPIVTLKSRRIERELNIKEGNRLRKQKERGHEDVTPSVTPPSADRVRVRVKSKNKEQEIREREREREREKEESASVFLSDEQAPNSLSFFSENQDPKSEDFGTPKNPALKDSLYSHPAVVALKRLTGHDAPQAIRANIAKQLGPQVDAARLARIYNDWISAGYSPRNWQGIADWYDGKKQQPGSSSRRDPEYQNETTEETARRLRATPRRII